MVETEPPSTPARGMAGLRVLVHILLGWFSAMVAENTAGAVILAAYALISGGEERLRQIATGRSGSVDGSLLILLAAAAAPAVWLWIWFYRRRLDRRSLVSLGLGRDRRVRGLLAGWLGGLLAPGLVLVVGLWFGGYTWSPGTGGSLSAAVSSVWPFVLPLAFLVEGTAEELPLRGYMQRSLLEWRGRDPHRAAWALLLPSLVFSLSHFNNPGYSPIAFVNTILIGVFLGCVTLSSGSLWPAFGAHGGWNLGLGMVWSLPVSGVQTFHLLPVAAGAASSTNLLLYGGEYGPEGGLAVTVLVVALLSWALPRAWEAGEDGEGRTEVEEIR